MLLLVDAAGVVTALALAFYLRAGFWPRETPLDQGTFVLFAAVAAPAYLTMLAVQGLYDEEYALTGRGQFGRLVAAGTLGVAAVVLLSFLVEEQISRGVTILTWLFSITLLGLGRWTLAMAVSLLRHRGALGRRLLVVGVDTAALALAASVERNDPGAKIVGYLDDFQTPGTTLCDGVHVIGDATRLEECVQRHAVDEVIVAPAAVTWESLQLVLKFASRHPWPRVRVLPSLYDALTTGVKVTYEGQVPLMSLEPLHIRGPQALLKRAMDYTLALALLPVALGVIALTWALSLIDRGGAALTTTRVSGPGAKPFGLLSLRRPANGRATWRRSLAESRLAKLPAVVNVLTGDLSLVGPRAIPLGTQANGAWPLYHVRPGLTGPWKFAKNGNGRGLPPEIEYVRRYSPWLDIRLLLGSMQRLVLRQAAVPLTARPDESHNGNGTADIGGPLATLTPAAAAQEEGIR